MFRQIMGVHQGTVDSYLEDTLAVATGFLGLFHCKNSQNMYNNYSLVQYYDNVKSGLINPHCPIFFCNLKTGGPPGLMNSFAWT